MVSSSKTAQSSSSSTSDERIIADGEGNAINSGGGDVMFVPDEAFDLANFALLENSELSGRALSEVADANSRALKAFTTAQRSESSQLAEQLVKIGLPVAALYFLSKGFFK